MLQLVCDLCRLVLHDTTTTQINTLSLHDALPIYSGHDATAQYRLTLAKVPGTVTVPVDDEGGPMTNGVNHTGVIDRKSTRLNSSHLGNSYAVFGLINKVLISELEQELLP